VTEVLFFREGKIICQEARKFASRRKIFFIKEKILHKIEIKINS
jgi:hypothetical protein